MYNSDRILPSLHTHPHPFSTEIHKRGRDFFALPTLFISYLVPFLPNASFPILLFL